MDITDLRNRPELEIFKKEHSNFEDFYKHSDYNNENGYYLNENSSFTELELTPNNLFKLKKSLKRQFEVICIYKGEFNLKINDIYGVYSIITDKINNISCSNQRYFVFTESYKMEYIPDLHFIEKNEYEKLKKNKKLKKEIERRIFLIETENLELENVKKERELKLKNEEIKKNFIEILNKEESFDKENSHTRCFLYNLAILFTLKMYLISTFVSIFMNELENKNIILMLFFILTIFFILITLFFLFKLKLKKKTMKKDFNELDLNTLSFSILGKIKYIENSIKYLKKINYNESIINLLDKTLNLTFKLALENKMMTNKIKIELNLYLNNCISYVDKLLNGKKFEEEIIIDSIINETIELIKDNNELLESMVKDYDLLYSMF